MAEKGSLDSDEHQGSFYWMVSRTSNSSEANMSQENVTFEQQIKVSLPAPKKRKVQSVHWDTSELPILPILVNKKAIKEHTKLLVFHAEKKNVERNSMNN